MNPGSNPDWLILARVLHILGVVIWIGGVGFVTAVMLPAVGKFNDPAQRAEIFAQLEGRFAWIARAATLLVGASGLYMIAAFDMWDRFTSLKYWWMHAMVIIWAIFTIMLFIMEPFFLHRRLTEQLRLNPERTLTRIQRAHWLLFLLSLITVAGAVAGAHGYTF